MGTSNRDQIKEQKTISAGSVEDYIARRRNIKEVHQPNPWSTVEPPVKWVVSR
jgi:hypothetical protein